ncbi:MAG TPA: crosslink repair DNA glycosylase YcaQ family protein [Candidatus Dormibacteraeota bacterium]|nr:crosslink repair DNA glycosylase YcaQ family protein [Candidatus Dormibacteraeota bacterium]
MTSAPRGISAAAARRFLVHRHLIAPPRSLPPGAEGVMRVVERLGSLQFDPLEVAGRNHDLVLLARVADYRREVTDALLYEERALFEAYNKGLSLLPTSELPWYRISWDRARGRHEGGAFDEHAPLVSELLERIRAGGELSPTDVAPRAAIDWYWRPTNQVRAILEALAEAGILGLRRRDGNRRVYDLIERLFPPALLAERRPEREQRRHKLLSRYRAHGLLGTGGQAELWYGTAGTAADRAELRAGLVMDGALIPVEVEGVRGTRYIVADEAGLLARAEAELVDGLPPGGGPPAVAFLAPLDPYVWDRDFLRALHAFDYVWEVYVPAAKRRWGYYVLPILFGDRLVGRIEPRIDRRSGALRILGLWWEPWFDPLGEEGFVAAFRAALEAPRRFAGLDRVTFPRVARHRAFVASLRGVPASAAPGPRS